MKTIGIILILFLNIVTFGQIQPAMLSLKGIGGSGVDQIGSYVTETSDGGFIINLGTNSSIGTGNLSSYCSAGGDRTILLKYNVDASILEWTKCYLWNGDSASGFFFPKNDGGLVLGGQFNSDNGWGLIISKHDASDNILWQKNYSKGKGAMLRSMIATEDGGYMMLGESYYIDTNVLTHYGAWSDADLWVIKVDSNGDKVWSKVIGGTGHESGAALVTAPYDGCYVIGGTGSNDYDCTGNHGGGEVYIARLNKDGDIMWHHDLGGSHMDVGINACSNGSGGVIIVAQTNSGDGDVHNYHGGSDYWVMEIDSNNNIVWDNCYGTIGYEVPSAICKATDGSIWVNGLGDDDIADNVYIVHSDNGGNVLSSRVLASSGQDRGQMIYPLSGGLVMAGGYYYRSDNSFSSITNYGFVDAFLTVIAP